MLCKILGKVCFCSVKILGKVQVLKMNDYEAKDLQ